MSFPRHHAWPSGQRLAKRAAGAPGITRPLDPLGDGHSREVSFLPWGGAYNRVPR
jgi:hypothetical protein